MGIDTGDLVVLLPKIERIRTFIGEGLCRGMLGIVIDCNASFNAVRVYGVAVQGNVYYLFEDEIEKLEEPC